MQAVHLPAGHQNPRMMRPASCQTIPWWLHHWMGQGEKDVGCSPGRRIRGIGGHHPLEEGIQLNQGKNRMAGNYPSAMPEGDSSGLPLDCRALGRPCGGHRASQVRPTGWESHSGRENIDGGRRKGQRRTKVGFKVRTEYGGNLAVIFTPAVVGRWIATFKFLNRERID